MVKNEEEIRRDGVKKENKKWGLVLCSVLIPVCLSACKQGTVEKQGSSNKEVQKKIDRKSVHLIRQDQLHHLLEY